MARESEQKQLMVKREKRAKLIAGAGLVKRSGDKFCVSTPFEGDLQAVYEVGRDDTGLIRCNCADYESASVSDSEFRCEHIRAVRHALAARNTESFTNGVRTEIRDAEPDKCIPTLNEPQNAREVPTQTDQQTGPEKTFELNNVLNFTNSPRDGRNYVEAEAAERHNGMRDVTRNTVAEILDDRAPNWTYEIRGINQIGRIVTVTAAISINGVTREGIGTGLADIEEGIKSAEQEAMNRAAAKFGVVVADSFDVERSAQKTRDAEFELPSNPIAKSISDLITARQLGMIRTLARESSVDANKECRTLMNCQTDELSRNAASGLIQHLQNLQNSPITIKQKTLRRAG